MMKKRELGKDLVHYMSLPYRTILDRDEDGDVIARIEELPVCMAHSRDEADALTNLASMKQLWLEDCLEAVETAPEPESPEPLPSGKRVQRVPRNLHRRLAQAAKREGVSLNQLITSMLSRQLSARN
jgi:antitoxin HicB